MELELTKEVVKALDAATEDLKNAINDNCDMYRGM